MGVIGSDTAVCAFVLARIDSVGRKYGQNDTAVRKKAGRRQASRTKKRRAGLTNGVTTC